MPKLLVLVLLAALLPISTPALGQDSVKDSVRVTRHVFQYKYRSGPQNAYHNCGAGIYATWPDVLDGILDRPTRYQDYTLVATEGQYVPTGSGQTLSNELLNIAVPEGHYGHYAGSTGTQGGSFGEWCDRYVAIYRALDGGAPNGLGFRMTDWYATYNIPDGTPIALFDWKQTQGLSVAFDGSFPDFSREVEVGGNKPVDEYLWEISDGATYASPTFTHTFAKADTFTVTLTVTDDDGETRTLTRKVFVKGVVLSFQAMTEAGTFTEGDEIAMQVRVTNIGAEDATEVRIPRRFGFKYTYPDGEEELKPYPNAPSDPTLSPDDGPGEEVTALAAGASTTVDVIYTVEAAARYYAGVQLVSVRADAKAYLGGILSGKNADGEVAAVIDECEEGSEESSCATEFSVQPVITTRITIEKQKVRIFNEFVARIEITNNGDAPFENVVTQRRPPPAYKVEYPEFVEPNRGSPPAFSVVAGPDPVTAVDPGGTATTGLLIRVDDLAKWSVPSDGSVQLVNAVLYLVSNAVQGRYKDRTVYAGCRSGRCDDTLEVRADIFNLELVGKTGQGQVAEVKTGLVRVPSLDDVSYVTTTAGEDGQLMPTCRSGCVDIEAVVTDNDGEPVEDVDVTLSFDAFPETPDTKGGRFLCERVAVNADMTCVDEPGELKLTTDKDGIARAWYAFPGLSDPKPFTVSGKIAVTPTLDVEADLGLRAQRNIVLDETRSPSSGTLVAGRTIYNSRLATRVVSVGEWCSTISNWLFGVAQSQAELSQLQYQTVKFRFNFVISAICDLGVGAVGVLSPIGAALAAAALAADAGNKALDLSLFTWFCHTYSVDNCSDLVAGTVQAGLPVVWYEGDFLDFINEAVALTPPDGVNPGPRRLTFVERSALNKWTEANADPLFDFYYGPTRNENDWQYMHMYFEDPGGQIDKVIAYGYDAEWLVENRDPEFEVVDLGLVTAEIAGTLIELGDYVLLESDTGAEMLQAVETEEIAGKTGSAGQRLQFSSPVQLDHAGAVTLAVVGPGEVAPPPAPILRTVDHVRPDTLVWAPHPTAFATGYDVELARDSLFTDLVVDLDSVAFNAHPVAEGQILIGETYYWRARSRNLVGDGAWSSAQAFTPTTGVATEPDVEASGPAALPAIYRVEAPYPNPSSGQTTLRVDLPKAGRVSAVVYDVLGREVETVASATLAAGRHELVVDLTGRPAGAYFVRVVHDEHVTTHVVTIAQ